jgi:succinate-semialdehyde dehydrogenase/glutarate-semialdehyde dehydrogenase
MGRLVSLKKAAMTTIPSINPATGQILREIEVTRPDDLPGVFARAREAQKAWGALSAKTRARHLFQLRETLLNHIDDVAQVISQETGKPVFEAMINDLLPSVDCLTFFAKHGPHLLRNRRINLSLMKHRRSYLNYWPLGVVVVISPWNYPFYLPFADIVMALIAGNAIVFKPSEVTSQVGLKIQELCDEAGLPSQVIQTVIGDGAVGAALIQQKPNKIFFTGSVPTGKKVMAAAAEHLIPVNLELGGKDAMIVLPDANLDFATSAALWGGFSNSGQACASVERILVHESVAARFVDTLKGKIEALRQGPSSGTENDLGAITYDKQKAVYERQIGQARLRGATFVTGGEFSADRRFLKPTIVTGPEIENLDIYNEETFGPVVAVTQFKSVDEAVRKANASRYGLMASVITRNQSLGEDIARRLEVGGVTINEVMYTAGLPETPWGGVKETGVGRTHSEVGLYEFVNVRHIHKPRSRLFVFKSFWWFPYTDYQFAMFRKFFELYRRSWLDRLRAFPLFLWNFVQFIKRERRI